MGGCEGREEGFERGVEGFCLGVFDGVREGKEDWVLVVVVGRWWGVPSGGGGGGGGGGEEAWVGWKEEEMGRF